MCMSSIPIYMCIPLCVFMFGVVCVCVDNGLSILNILGFINIYYFNWNASEPRLIHFWSCILTKVHQNYQLTRNSI